jgi:hypothetical protein
MMIEESNNSKACELALSSSTRPVPSSKQSAPIAAYSGYALLLNAAYMLGFLILGNRSNQSIEIIDKLNGFVSLFPTIIVGHTLEFPFLQGIDRI